MPRPKGSKNKPKLNKLATAADYAAAIEAKTTEKAQLEQNISEILEDSSLKAQLKANRAALKAAGRPSKAGIQKGQPDAKAAMAAQKNELESTVQAAG